ncbi:MAG TPA: hypothetical protein VK188_04370 [Holophaga sp.]|nr:hypothetical protein [Holophaga sp.]
MLGPSLLLLLSAVPGGPAATPLADPVELRLCPAVVVVLEDGRRTDAEGPAEALPGDEGPEVVPLLKATVLPAPETTKEP